jgi:hypothetical protein
MLDTNALETVPKPKSNAINPIKKAEGNRGKQRKTEENRGKQGNSIG